jgi:competence protein ComEA
VFGYVRDLGNSKGSSYGPKKGGLLKGGIQMKRYKTSMALLLAVALLLALFPFSLAQEANKININQASAEELTQLKGIGIKYAERIVQFRGDNGPFKAPEDIMKVPGIGLKIFEANKDIITVE